MLCPSSTGVLSISVSIALAALALGCVRAPGATGRPRQGGAERAAQTRAAHDLRCSEDRVVVSSIGGGAVVARGCGLELTYTCVRTDGFGGHACAPDGPPRGERTPDTWTDAQVEALLARLSMPVARCMGESMSTLSIEVAISARGRVRRVGPEGLPEPLATCVDGVVAAETLAGAVEQPRTAGLTFRIASSDDEPPADAANAVRAALDTRAPAILACVEATAVSLEVSWTTEGRLDAALRGDRHGTADEECVRAVVRQLSVPAPGASGQLVHALQR